MGFNEAVKSVLSQYANFEGRARRSEYWYWTLANMLAVFSVFLLNILLSLIHESLAIIGGLLLLILILGGFIPSLAVAVRRLHDTGKSGWFLLLGVIPFGGIVLLVFECMEGNPGPNQYGPDPKGGFQGGPGYPMQPNQYQPYPPQQQYPPQQPYPGQQYPPQY
ncbi:DUF805 domain-containing protein [Nocardia huaxiensis]|uniref:DUF805 domain-containing protein n=1 Tax=Nocardia huaxiensis TaxID=2755382 RepID=UPI001E432C6F|nr:DUF805 domain-containing protein [Nocardia huaxiensis]UFS94669.1 DUF805 domain-containing protein [Nocardia huaxiensis]